MNKNELNQTEGITNMVSKEGSNNMREIIQSAATIIGVIAFAFIVMLFCQKAMAKDAEPELTIGTNSAERDFYNADYDGAISLYESDKQKDEWPMYKVKEAEAYSLKGDYTYSNRLLSEAYDTRNNLIRKNGMEKYEEEDKELGHLIVFTALMNGDAEKAQEYGEIFFLDDCECKELYKTMFTVYLANGKTEEAEGVLNNLNYDETSAKEISETAYMYSIIGNYNETMALLNKAYELDNNEVKIYDVLEDLMVYHSDKVIDTLKTLSKKNSNELSYKAFLAKCYSLNGSTVKEAEKILNDLKEENLTSAPYKIIQADIYKNSGEVNKYNEVIEEIIESEKDNYFGEYIAAKYAYENKEYAQGIEYAKNSIIDNRDYVNTYSIAMPELLYAEKESEKTQGYLRTALYKEPFNYNNIIRLANYCGNVQQDADKASKYYTLALAVDKDNAEVYYDMASLKAGLNKKDEAVSLLEKAIKINDKEVKYYRKLGSVYIQAKEKDKAIKAIRKAYDINNNDINTLNDAGYYYMTVGEIGRAVTNFKAAYEGINDSTDLSVKNVITKNYEKVKEYSENKIAWSKSSIEDFKYVD